MNVFCSWLVLLCLCKSARAVWPETPFQAVNYLLRYGYLNPDYSMKTNPSKFLHYAIKNFQKKSSLEITGELDEFTLHQMQKKRCGVPDFTRQKYNQIFIGRPKMHVLLNKRDATQAHWGKTDLTYYIKSYTEDLPKDVIDETVEKALQMWENVSKLNFTKVNDSTADIVIEFAQGEHGDGVPFDGPGGTLAHAYFPEMNINPLEGDAHFDEDETWVVDPSQNGTNFFCTAVHEFGHSLGLAHTYNGEDIMFPYERDCFETGLSELDILSIQYLYGKPENSTTTTQSIKELNTTTKLTTLEPTTTATTVPTTTVSTTTTSAATTPITTTTTTTTTATENPLTASYPTTNVTTPMTTLLDSSTTKELLTRRPISPFPELCNGIPDAITYGADGNLYVFIELLVFALDSRGIIFADYTFISEIFPRAPNTVDSAFTINVDDYEKDGHIRFTYLIQGYHVWKYSFRSDYKQFQLVYGYPRHQIDDFSHAPIMARAAFFADGITYLIDHEYYMEYHYDCERAIFEPFEHSQSLRASNYFRNFPKGVSIDAAWVSSGGDLNIIVEYDWYVIDSIGDIKNRSKTVTLFGCEMVVVPDRHKHSPHIGKHSPHRGKHSSCRGKHSPHKGKHSPRQRKHSPHKRKHSHKKRKKSPKRGRHRRSRQGKLYHWRR